jgi:hypothetical protein
MNLVQHRLNRRRPHRWVYLMLEHELKVTTNQFGLFSVQLRRFSDLENALQPVAKIAGSQFNAPSVACRRFRAISLRSSSS